MSAAFLCSFAFFASAGCSSSSSDDGSGGGGTNAVDGTVGSLSVDAKSAIAVAFSADVTGNDAGSSASGDDDDDAGSVGSSSDGLSIAIADKSNSCGGVHDANSTVLVLNLTGSVRVATYPVVAGHFASAGQATANISHNDATCSSGTYPLASGGQVVVQSASADSVSGTFDLTFASGDRLTGSFSAPICSKDPTLGSDGGVLCST